MRRALLVLALSVASSSLVACAPVRTRPSSLADAASASESAQSKEAAQLAPTSFAEAEGYRREAEEAYARGDGAAAQFLGERAVAAYARAFVHARTVRAQVATEEGKKELAKAEAELQRLRDEQTRAAADVAAIEMRIKVARDAVPLAAVDAADPSREAARLEAARALATEARLLCVSTRLFAPQTEGLKEADDALAELTKKLVPQTKPAPVDAATRARAACLAALTKARRATGQAPAVDPSDALLGELSREGTFSPARDDRGVVVTVHDAFAGNELSKTAAGQIELAAKIAAAHPAVPVLLVVHDAGEPSPADQKRDEARGDAAKRAFAKVRADKLDVALAGGGRPVVDPKSRERARNERLEIVFVDAGAGAPAAAAAPVAKLGAPPVRRPGRRVADGASLVRARRRIPCAHLQGEPSAESAVHASL